MICKIEKRKSVLKPAVVVVLATTGLGLLTQAASANPLVRSAVLADSASQDAIKVAWRDPGYGQHFHHRFYRRYGYYGHGYRPYPRYGQGWGYRGRHYFY